MIDPALEGRVALVTGANCGIGEAIAGALAAHGCAVGLTYLRLPLEHTADPGLPESYGEQRARSGEDVAAALRAAGHRATAIEADLAEDDAPVRVFDHAERELGPVEILVHNASSWLADTFAAARSDDFGRDLEGVSSASHDRQFAVDARAGAALIAAFAARHRARDARWGRILALTSSGRDGFPGEVSYGAAKAALESYVKSAALELGRDGITANLIHPPVTDTGWLTEETRETLTQASPLRHIGAPRDVADAVVLLASRLADCITGNVVTMH